MGLHQQYTCPKCSHIGACSVGLKQGPLCDQCDYKVRMMKSHNGVIMEIVKVKIEMKVTVEFDAEQPIPHYLGGDIIKGMLLGGKTSSRIPSAVNSHIDEVFSGTNFRINNMHTILEVENISANEETD